MPIISHSHTPFPDRLDTFTDRKQILDQFHRLLSTAQPGQFQVCGIKGNSGIGKTFLIEYLARRVCPQAGWQSGQLAFVQSTPNFRTILDGLEDALKACVPRESLKAYRIKREEYNRRFDEYRASIVITSQVEAHDHSSVSNVDLDSCVNIESRQRELQLRAEQSRTLIELAEESKQPLCLFIDGYEHLVETDTELVGWLWEELLMRLAKTSPYPLLVVTSGWEWPSGAAIKPFLWTHQLEDFDRENITTYLFRHHIISLDKVTVEQEELVDTFYNLSKGHPLVLSLAVTYFSSLPEQERSAAKLHAGKPLIDDRARVEFLDERLLSRLPEPFRTLLERGPLLRTFDVTVLSALLAVKIEGSASFENLDNRAYERFLQYPFIHFESSSSDPLLIRATFHDLIQHVRRAALRRLYPEIKERLHWVMANYHHTIVTGKQIPETIYTTAVERRSLAYLFFSIKEELTAHRVVRSLGGNDWLLQMPEQTFLALLEHYYHALQVRGLQQEIFDCWNASVQEALKHWQRQRANSLLEIIHQLAHEGEPMFSKGTTDYAHYLVHYAAYQEQEAHWNEALALLKEALQIFKSNDTTNDITKTLRDISKIYEQQGKFDRALGYQTQIATLYERQGDYYQLAQSFSRIANLYHLQGKLELALQYYERALTESDKIALNTSSNESIEENIEWQNESVEEDTEWEEGLQEGIKVILYNDTLHSIAEIYEQQGAWRQTINSHELILAYNEKYRSSQNPSISQDSLIIWNVGACRAIADIHTNQGNFDIAASYENQALTLERDLPDDWKKDNSLNRYQQELALQEQQGNPVKIASTLGSIAWQYSNQKQWNEALSHYERALALWKQMGNSAEMIQSLNHIGFTYQRQKQWQKALDYYSQALALCEQMGRNSETAELLQSMAFLYNQQDKWEEALIYYERALVLRKQGEQSAEIAEVLAEIADLYEMRDRYRDALKYYTQSLRYYDKMGTAPEIAELLEKIAGLCQEQEMWDQALIHSQRALTLREKTGDLLFIVLSLRDIGFIYADQEQWKQALSHYERALALSEQLDDIDLVTGTLNDIASLYRDQRKWRKALEYYKRVLALCERDGNLPEVARSLDALGSCYQDQEQWKRALSYYEQALAIREQLEDISQINSSLNTIAILYKAQGNWKHAYIYLERILAIYEHIGDSISVASTLRTIGSFYQEQKQWEKALSYYERAIVLFKQEGNLQKEASTLTSVAELYKEEGKGEMALKYYEQTLTLIEPTNNITGVAAILSFIAIQYVEQGEYEKSLSTSERALMLFEELGDLHMVAVTLNLMSTSHIGQEQWEEALKYCTRALPLLEEMNDTDGLVAALNLMSTSYTGQEQWEEALSHCEQALALLNKVDDMETKAETFTCAGFIYGEQGQWEEALGYYQQALPLLEQMDNLPESANTHKMIGVIYSEQGKHEEALNACEKALSLFEQMEDPAGVASSFAVLGIICQELGRLEDAIQYYTEALNLYESLGSDFETAVADELEQLAECYAQTGADQKSSMYKEQAQRIRENLQET